MEKTVDCCRLATYNIHGGRGMDNVLDLKRIADVIKTLDADFIAINEIDCNCVRSGSVDQVQILAELLNMNYYFAPALEMRSPRFPEQGDQVGLYGVAFYTPHPIAEIRQFALPGLPEMEPRTAVLVRVDAPQRSFYAVVTHFCWEAEYEKFRTASVGKINEVVTQLHEEQPDVPVFLLGDLNAEPYSEPIMELRKDWQIANEGNFQATHPADSPQEIIDYIMLKPANAGKLLNTRIVPEMVASDHRPLATEVQFC